MTNTQLKIQSIIQYIPRCIHLAGVDGSGKTTQSKALLSLLREHHQRIHYAWLRFPRFFTIPFLIYARLCGFSYREVVEGNEHGYWEFDKSWIMSTIFPWVLWFDALLLALLRVFIPTWMGEKILCDRFIIDTLVDLMVGLNKPDFDMTKNGQMYLKLLPKDTCVVILDIASSTAMVRSPELVGDRTHEKRREMYLTVANRHGFPVISAEFPIHRVTSQLLCITVSTRNDVSE